MKEVFVAVTVAALLATTRADGLADPNSKERQELNEKTAKFWDAVFGGALKTLQDMKTSGKAYSAADLDNIVVKLGIVEFKKHTAEWEDLNKAAQKLGDSAPPSIPVSDKLWKDIKQATFELYQGPGKDKTVAVAGAKSKV